MEREIINTLVSCFKNGNKVLICGCGGSASMAQHMAAELVGKFEYLRKALPAIALTTDSSILTAWSNDFTFISVFARQCEAIGKPGDVLVALSTSGKSPAVLEAVKTATQLSMTVIDFPRLGNATAEIQENQLKLMHQVVREVELAFVE
jgi:phosphoheptose isomerase